MERYCLPTCASSTSIRARYRGDRSIRLLFAVYGVVDSKNARATEGGLFVVYDEGSSSEVRRVLYIRGQTPRLIFYYLSEGLL